MKLAVIGDEVSQDLATVVETVAQLGFDGVEVRSIGDVPPHELTDAQLSEVRTAVTAAGLAVAGFAPPALKCRPPRTDDELTATRGLLLRAGEQARLLGAPHLRMFSFYRDGEPDPVAAARAAARVLDGVDPPVPLLVETGTRTNTPTVAHTLRFLDELGRDDIGVLWDPGNTVFGGAHDAPFPGEYELGAAVIRHVHVKDPDGTAGYVRLGDGSLDWPAILDRLADDGYQGYVSLETHWRIGRTLSARERDDPWGVAFSRGGYAASVECMQQLLAWVGRRHEALAGG